jgi:hypothetical protein
MAGGLPPPWPATSRGNGWPGSVRFMSRSDGRRELAGDAGSAPLVAGRFTVLVPLPATVALSQRRSRCTRGGVTV